ncbi:Uncharacterised protein [Vibrio cholerae]|nr:Uncharacterised protein [Vibrio cholerae]CSI34162.1 Uncharacterised protein [Vibrio cholerae]
MAYVIFNTHHKLVHLLLLGSLHHGENRFDIFWVKRFS